MCLYVTCVALPSLVVRVGPKRDGSKDLSLLMSSPRCLLVS